MAHIKTAVWVLVTCMILSVVITYGSILSLLNFTKQNIKNALDSFVVENSVYIYNSIKNGNDFTEDFNETDYMERLKSDYTLESDGEKVYSKNKDGDIIFSTSIPDVSFQNINSLDLTAKLDVYIPVYFAGKAVSNLKIPLKVETTHNIME